MALTDYEIESFTHDGITHDVYHRGEGPCVLVAAEIPGITPNVTAFSGMSFESVGDQGQALAEGGA